MKMNSLRVALSLLAASAAAYSASAQTKLNGAGATFPAPLYQRWIAEFTKANPGIQINYQAVGSGTGITNFTQGIVNFAGSDAASTSRIQLELIWEQMKSGSLFHRTERKTRCANLVLSPET